VCRLVVLDATRDATVIPRFRKPVLAKVGRRRAGFRDLRWRLPCQSSWPAPRIRLPAVLIACHQPLLIVGMHGYAPVHLGSARDFKKEDTVQETTGGSTSEELKDTAQHLTEETKGTATNLAGKAKEQVRTKASEQKQRAVGSLEEVTQTLHSTGSQLQEQGQETLGNLLDGAASQIDSLTDYLRGRNVEDLFRDLEDVARRKPTVFIGGAFILGLAAARFLKSSSPSSSQSSGWQDRSWDASGSASYGSYGAYGQHAPGGVSGGVPAYDTTPDIAATSSAMPGSVAASGAGSGLASGAASGAGIDDAASNEIAARDAVAAWSSERSGENVTEADLEDETFESDVAVGTGRSDTL